MTKRELKPTGRKLKVRWSTEEWKPTIRFARVGRRQDEARTLQIVLDRVAIERERQRKRKIQPQLWLRAGGRTGSRSTWR